MSKIAGTCYIKVDGAQLEINGGVEVPLSHVKRETVMSDSGPAGHSETATKPYVKLTAVVGKDFPLEKLQKSTNMTVTAELANGIVYTLSDAYVEGDPPPIKASEAMIDLEFGGMNGSHA